MAQSKKTAIDKDPNHWIALHSANRNASAKLYLFDPVGKEMLYIRSMKKNFDEFWRYCKPNDRTNHNWFYKLHQNQQDGINCGVLCLEYVAQFLQDKQTVVRTDFVSCRNYRIKLTNMLLKATNPLILKYFCLHCNTWIDNDVDSWRECFGCGGRVHEICCASRTTIPTDFLCRSCLEANNRLDYMLEEPQNRRHKNKIKTAWRNRPQPYCIKDRNKNKPARALCKNNVMN